MSEVTVSYSVNTTNKYYSSGSITYDIYNIRSYNASTLNGAAYYTLQTSFVPSTCDIGVQNGFQLTGPTTKPQPYISLPGFLYAGEATYALPNIIDDVFGNTTASYGTTTTTVYATDGDTGNILVGATLNIKDVENNSWVNATSTMTGIPINTLPSHTLDIYGSYPGVYNESSELGATPGGPYYLPLFQYRAAPLGYVYLYVTVRDASTGLTLLNSPVTAKLPTGATEGTNTGSSGTASFLVPNNTIIIVGASSPGYTTQSMSTTTGIVNKHIYVDLPRATVTTGVVTPTVTDPATGQIITPQPTQDSRTNLEKDSDLLNILRTYGETIMLLCIIAIIMGLVKMMGKW
jgi:hypothetical protein